MASRRQIIGGVVSVLLHGSLLGWVATQTPEREQAPEPLIVTIERIEIASIAGSPLSTRAAVGLPSDDALSEAARSEGLPMLPGREPEPEPTPTVPSPPRPDPLLIPAPTEPASEPSPAIPAVDDPAPAEPLPTAPATDEPVPPEPPASPATDGPAGGTPTAGGHDDHGSLTSSIGRMGTDESPDHSAYGAELVRLVKSEIDADPVPGLLPHDSIEVVLEVLPSGRLARHGMGKYDYAKVVRSTLGPLRLRAILRRILNASHGFPPHPSSFPRRRYVVGFTVNFRKRGG